MSVGKKLSIAFYWHMHQPTYQLSANGDYLMPWARLHAVKDYLDMALFVEKFKNLKLNFNIVPLLLDTLEDYAHNEAHDIHSRLSVTDENDLTQEDKEFILNNFFDANYKTMIFHHEKYEKLYQKRFSRETVLVSDFTNQEYSNIMAWFNLSWMDVSHKNTYPVLKQLLKQEDFTLEDRFEIIKIHRDILGKIIPTYKKLQDEGKIEVTTSPYYHPILPILLDVKEIRKTMPNQDEIPEDLDMAQDAKLQTELALDKMESVFGKRPKGVWPSEHCISEKTVEMFKELGVQWTISDEGILAKSLNKEFVRDFQGYLEDPYFLMKSYKYKTPSSDIKLIFRDSTIPNLISFEYSNHDPKIAANDLYERIKIIQSKLQSSPDNCHLLTIALDGENCWENYPDDGTTFLKTLYALIEEDQSLDTALISEYLSRGQHHKTLKKIHPGSWINRNFKLWIDEPVKNLAWTYLKQVRDDLVSAVTQNPNHAGNDRAYRELMVAQGSDWFWWYGEPNDSGQDHIFDYLFREHLKNVYYYLDLEAPSHLDLPLISAIAKPSRYPKSTITPLISGTDDDDDKWLNAGCIDMPDGPVLEEKKLFDRICFGFDEDNLYFRFYLKQIDTTHKGNFFHQMYIYIRNSDKKQLLSPIRLVNRTENIYPMMKEKFHNEFRVSINDGQLYPIQLIQAMQSGLWRMKSVKEIKVAFDKVIDVSIPFDKLEIAPGEHAEFFFANASSMGVKDSFIPQDVLLNIQRPQVL